VLSPTLYVHAWLEAGARLALDEEHAERAVYVVEGTLGCDERAFGPGALVVLRAGDPVHFQALSPVRAMILGGAELAGERHVFWNFVASSAARIERAKQDYREGRFPPIPGDSELIPLPER